MVGIVVGNDISEQKIRDLEYSLSPYYYGSGSWI
jgi:hypothetical protein